MKMPIPNACGRVQRRYTKSYRRNVYIIYAEFGLSLNHVPGLNCNLCAGLYRKKGDVMLTDEKFIKWREILAGELLTAYANYSIWEQLWPSEENVQVLNEYRTFFHYTVAAHLQLFILYISKLTENRKDSINLWRFEVVPKIRTGC
jgi:hypothetical protein